MRINNVFTILLLLLVNITAAFGQGLIISVHAAGKGMTWMDSQDYDVFVRDDGLLVYSGLHGATPVLRTKTLSKDTLEKLKSLSRDTKTSHLQQQRDNFLDCSIDLKILAKDGKGLISGTKLSCGLTELPPDVHDLLCELDSLRNDEDGRLDLKSCPVKVAR